MNLLFNVSINCNMLQKIEVCEPKKKGTSRNKSYQKAHET